MESKRHTWGLRGIHGVKEAYMESKRHTWGLRGIHGV